MLDFNAINDFISSEIMIWTDRLCEVPESTDTSLNAVAPRDPKRQIEKANINFYYREKPVCLTFKSVIDGVTCDRYIIEPHKTPDSCLVM
jgi:hypothetical protein